MRGLAVVPQAERLKARQQVIAGGPQREAPATHIEWVVHRSALEMVLSWRFWWRVCRAAAITQP